VSVEISNEPKTTTVGSLGKVHRFKGRTSKQAEPVGVWKKFGPWLPVVIAVVVGFFIGSLVTRQHYKASDAVAAVNGTVITQTRMFNLLNDMSGTQALQQIVSTELQIQFAKTRGVVVSDDQVNAYYEKLTKAPNYALILKSSGVSPALFRDALPLRLTQEAVFTQGLTVDESDIQNYYNAETNPRTPNALFYRPQMTSLQVIATPSKSDADAAMAQLANQVPFAIVAQRYSVETSRSSGGQIAPLVLGKNPLSRDPGLEQSVFALDIGDTMPPTLFGGRWWIFKCLDKSPSITYPLSEVADQAQEGALLQKGVQLNGQSVGTAFKAFEKTAVLQALRPEYQSVMDHQ
jgi:parvulin-like peptidyl-prolyl isomerase